MNQSSIKIEENDSNSLASVFNLIQMNRNMLGRDKVSHGISFISYSALDHSQLNLGGISGWKSFDFSYIESLWVSPSVQKKGIGTQLLQQFIEKSKNLGCSTIIVSTTNVSNSLLFWKKHRFIEFAEFQTAQVEVKSLKLII